MKNKLLAVVVLLLFGLVFVHGQTDRLSGPPGKFQIVAVEYDVFLPKKDTLRTKGFVKIDTQTGQTWIWSVTVEDTGKVVAFWKALD